MREDMAIWNRTPGVQQQKLTFLPLLPLIKNGFNVERETSQNMQFNLVEKYLFPPMQQKFCFLRIRTNMNF